MNSPRPVKQRPTAVQEQPVRFRIEAAAVGVVAAAALCCLFAAALGIVNYAIHGEVANPRWVTHDALRGLAWGAFAGGVLGVWPRHARVLVLAVPLVVVAVYGYRMATGGVTAIGSGSIAIGSLAVSAAAAVALTAHLLDRVVRASAA